MGEYSNDGVTLVFKDLEIAGDKTGNYYINYSHIDFIVYVYERQIVGGLVTNIPIGFSKVYLSFNTKSERLVKLGYEYGIINLSNVDELYTNRPKVKDITFEYGEYNKGYYVDAKEYFEKHVKKDEDKYKMMKVSDDDPKLNRYDMFGWFENSKRTKFNYLVFLPEKPKEDISYIKVNYCGIEEIYRADEENNKLKRNKYVR